MSSDVDLSTEVVEWRVRLKVSKIVREMIIRDARTRGSTYSWVISKLLEETYGKRIG